MSSRFSLTRFNRIYIGQNVATARHSQNNRDVFVVLQAVKYQRVSQSLATTILRSRVTRSVNARGGFEPCKLESSFQTIYIGTRLWLHETSDDQNVIRNNDALKSFGFDTTLVHFFSSARFDKTDVESYPSEETEYWLPFSDSYVFCTTPVANLVISPS